METIQPIMQEYGFWLAIAVLAFGIILGFTKTIVVYRDYADLTKVFMLLLAPFGVFLLAMKFGELPQDWMKRIKILVGILEIGLLIWVLVTTFLDNRNIFKTLLAFVTKIPLGVIFAFYLAELFLSSGKTGKGKRQSRGVAALIMLILLPILYGLVQHKVWTYKEKAAVDAEVE